MRKLESAVALRPQAAPVSSGIRAMVRSGSRLALPEQQLVLIDSVETDPNQPRTFFDPEKLEGLAEDIRIRGIINPITLLIVGPERYRLICGERRLRAAKLAGLETIPAVLYPHLSDEDLELMRLRENLQREDLSPMETARGLRRYKEMTGKTWENVGADFGWKKPTVLDKIRVLDAPEPVQTLIEEQRIPSTHYTQLLRQLPEDQQVSLARQAAEEEWTRQDLKRRLLHLTEEPEEGPSVSLSEGISGYTPGSNATGEERPQSALQGMSGHTPGSDETEENGEADHGKGISGYTPGSASLEPGRRKKTGQYTEEIRTQVSPDLARQLRHHAVELTKGSVTAMNRQLLEWFNDRLNSGQPAPWQEEEKPGDSG